MKKCFIVFQNVSNLLYYFTFPYTPSYEFAL